MTDVAENITLEVEGMTCASCALSVTKSLEAKGCENISVNYALGEARFDLKQGVSIEEVIRNLDRVGYKSQKKGGLAKKTGISSLEKKFYFTLVFTIPLFSHMFFPKDSIIQNPILQFALCLPVFLVGLLHFGKSAFQSIRLLAPNMDVLIFIGSTAAFGYSMAGAWMNYGTEEVHNYLFFETAATIISLVLLGNVLEARSVRQTTSAIEDLTRLKPTHAKKIVRNGLNDDIAEVAYEDIQPGDQLMVHGGDRIPVDGTVRFGSGIIDESAITGESEPVTKSKDQELTSGTLLIDGTLTMVADVVGADTTLARIIELVSEAQHNKPAIQRLGDKVSNVFVPIVLVISLLTFLIGWLGFGIELQQALMNSIAVLVISCPCAMGLATPTAVMAGLGRAAKSGILIKGGSTLEELASIKQIVFDKTGTLTDGQFEISDLEAVNSISEEELRSLVYSMERYSSHPIALSITKELEGTDLINLQEINEERGLGITAKDGDGNIYQLGSHKMASAITEDSSHSIYLTKNDNLVGWLDIRDRLKPDAKKSIESLQEMNINTILLSGDRKEKTESVARELGIKKAYFEQSPLQKLEVIDQLNQREPTAMVGDGINDAPALAKASVGISLGKATDVAINSSRVILLSGELSKLVEASRISRHTLITIKQNLFWAFFYNVIAIPIAAVGLLNPMIGALAMAASDVVVIGNSIRLKTKKLR